MTSQSDNVCKHANHKLGHGLFDDHYAGGLIMKTLTLNNIRRETDFETVVFYSFCPVCGTDVTQITLPYRLSQ